MDSHSLCEPSLYSLDIIIIIFMSNVITFVMWFVLSGFTLWVFIIFVYLSNIKGKISPTYLFCQEFSQVFLWSLFYHPFL